MGVAAKTFAASTANLLSFPFKISIVIGLFSFLGTFVFLLCYYCDRIHSFYYLPILILMIVLLATAILMLVFSIHSLYLKISMKMYKIDPDILLKNIMLLIKLTNN